ncbi:hypothetical protein AXF42_Ash000924 [Apostasia shenzhenica]|uniref:Uncharacterized protein n=1 Tax=Apostasia shenzhenica TaxID=1088818 RepID=A0A2I0ATG5_9ASPA|nr:hypothetical protein AXF42_Ash000924 [Apostasia shenzhenica]
MSPALTREMETLISNSLLLRQSILRPSSRVASAKAPSVSYAARPRCCWKSKTVTFCCSSSSSPDLLDCSYGGWEELDLLEGTRGPGTFDPFLNFLSSLGFDNRKHALPFCLGFFAAVAVSRVRFSSIALLPVSMLAFAFGFTKGTAYNGVVVSKLGRNGVDLGVFRDKLKELEALFCDLDGKMSGLREGLERGIDSVDLGTNYSESYLQIVDQVQKAIGQAQIFFSDSFSNELLNDHIDFEFGVNKLNQKSGKKRNELGASGVDFFDFLTGMLHETFIGSKMRKPKESIKDKHVRQLNPVERKDSTLRVSDREVVAVNDLEEQSKTPFHRLNHDMSQVEEEGILSDDKQRRETKTPEKDKFGNRFNDVNSLKFDASELNGTKNNFGMLSFAEEIDKQRRNFHFMTNSGSSRKIVFKENYESEAFHIHIRDSYDGDTSIRRTKNMDYLNGESKLSLLLQHALESENRTYGPSRRSERGDLENKSSNWQLGVYPISSNQQSIHPNRENKIPHSSNVSSDEQFEHNLKEATDLLKCAREYMMTQDHEETADAMLYKAAELLSAAVAMRPMSVIAMGQLGNTYLLHGELKLNFSRGLRTLFLRSDAMFHRKPGDSWFKKIDSTSTSREHIASVLVSVCEESEELLVEAGRKYRRALSIDGNDVRALYNWGLALCFRAELIADVGPEAAIDADKIYLAAIDKFNAMASRSNAYTPEALYRWGVALQDRSRLRQNHSREKAKLLHQAKSLFEEVLSMESDNQHVREALSSCISELNYDVQI